MKNKLILMLSLLAQITGVIASEQDNKFEQFKAETLNSNNLATRNQILKEQADKFGSIDLAAGVYLATVPFVALYNRQNIPPQASMSDLVGVYSCLSSSVWLDAQLYKAQDDKEKQDKIINDFKDTYEKCMELHKSVDAKIEQSKK